jgi:diguanylate cyclase (GGDEF)-like protein
LGGDVCLQTLATAVVTSCLRSVDLIARYGGEEFLILLPHSSLEEAQPIAERLRELVAIGCGRQTGEGVSLSCGVAQMFKGESLDELVVRADAALRRAKENGRDRVEMAE